jgi:hypothetical protein
MIPTSFRRQPTRISFSALLRVQDDDRYVLFLSSSRPGSFGPPGGVIKYFEPATRALDKLGFRAERTAARGDVMRSDLRGFLPTGGAVRHFLRWFATGAYREDGTECLRRELHHEFSEVGHPYPYAGIYGQTFAHVRTVMDGPFQAPNKPFRQLRRFEVYDLMTTSNTAVRLHQRLIELGRDPAVRSVLRASQEDIVHGRSADAMIAPQSAFLVGKRRYLPDLPPLLPG